jgi:hypothetical protein
MVGFGINGVEPSDSAVNLRWLLPLRKYRHRIQCKRMYFRSRKTSGVEKHRKKGDAGNCNGSFAP